MKRKMTFRIVATLLIVVLAAGMLSSCGRKATKKGTQNNQNSQQGGEGGNNNTPTPIPEGYVQITFALPSDATESEKQYTTLPEAVVVPAGTQYGSLPAATRVSSMFLGWSEAEKGSTTVDETTAVEQNITLYPRFALKDGMVNGGALNYVASKDVARDFTFELVSYGLTEEEIRNLLKLENASISEDNLPYVLVSVKKAEEIAKMKELGLDDETAGKVYEAALKEKEQRDGFEFAETIRALKKSGSKDPALTNNQVLTLTEMYAPDEVTTDRGFTDVDGNPLNANVEHLGKADLSDVKLDAETMGILNALNIDLDSATDEEIKRTLGISEDDSLQRYFREELELSVEQVQALEDYLRNREISGDRYKVMAKDGLWEGGYLYSLTISDTAKLRFVYDGKVTDDAVNEYNITVYQEEVKNISIDSRVKYIPADKVQGVEFVSILDLDADEDGNLIPKENMGSGVMTYTGSDKLAVGTVIAVNKGNVQSNGFTNDNVTYIKVKKDLGSGRYEYENAGVADVIFLPDIIPVKDDGSLSDGVIKIAAGTLNFANAAYKKYGLSADSVMEAGDYLAFYTGVLGGANYKETGYGEITEVKSENGAYTVSYKIITKEKVYDDEDLLYMEMPEVELTVSEAESEELEKQMREEILKSGLVEETSDFLTALVLGQDTDIDSLDHAEEIRNMTIKGEDGAEMTLDDLRLLSDGAESVKVSDIKVTFLCGIDLQHFKDKKGVRAEVGVSFTISIKIKEAGTLEITPAIVLEQEFLLTPGIKVKRNKNKLGLTSSLDITAKLEAGVYTGFGVCVTAMTKNNPNPNKDKDWEEMVQNFTADNGNGETDQKTREAKMKAAKVLIKAGNKLIDKAKKEESKGQGQGYSNEGGTEQSGSESKQDYVSPGIGGDLPTKYSGMLSNNAEYINLVDIDLASADFPVDPLNIVHCGIKVKFVVALKINAMIGAGISYENAKEYSYSFRAKIWGGGDEYTTGNAGQKSGSSVKDLKTPNFRADFYAFGMVGVKAGVSIDLRVGLFSTDLDSVGVVASAGIYAELYGFLYCWYEWTSGQGSTSGAMGSLLFEIGIYTDISVKVQVGMGKASKSWSLYNKKTPLVQLGCTEFPLDFVIKPNDSKLSVKINDGENTVKVPDELFEMKMMALNSGKISNKNMDSKNVCDKDTKEYTVNVDTTGKVEGESLVLSTRRKWIQYNEDHFLVECFDLTGKDGKVKEGASSFQYLPGTNEIYVCPVDLNTDEVWGKVVFTFKNNAFGFSTQKLQRTVYVHWKGTRQTAKVEFYLQERPNHTDTRIWKLAGSGSVSGYDGIRCYVDVDENLTKKFTGYNLLHLGYPDEAELKNKQAAAAAERVAAERRYHHWSGEHLVNPNNKEYEEKAKEAEKEFIAKMNISKLYTTLLDEYEETNAKAIADGKGTTWFTMRGSTTVIRIYYLMEEYPTQWDIVGTDLSLDQYGEGVASSEWTADENSFRGRRYHTEMYWIQPDFKAMDYMPAAVRDFRKDSYTTEWYMYEYTWPYRFSWSSLMYGARNDALNALKNNDFSHITKVTADTKVPHGYVVFIGVQTPKEFTVRWMDANNRVVATTKVATDAKITVPAGLNPTKPGYRLAYWVTENGLEINTMPGHDITVYPVFHGNEHTVTFVTDDGKSVQKKGYFGGQIYELLPEELEKENYQMLLRYGQAADSEEVAFEAKIPDKDITIYIRYTLGYSKITWMDNGKILSTTIVEIGTTPEPPAVQLKSGEDFVWMIDGKVMDSTYVMPRGDVTATGFHHVHDWSGESVTIEATCAHTGLAGYTCSLCGLVKDGVELPIVPDRHNWEEIVLSDPTCTIEGDILRRCLWCHTEVHVPIPVNPENHLSWNTRVNVKSETCAEEGYTGDFVCDACGAVIIKGDVIPKNNNHFDDGVYVVVREADCTNQGLKVSHCTVCGCVTDEWYFGPFDTAHVWGDEIIVKAPTCDYGVAKRICKICGEEYEYGLGAVQPHNLVFVDETGGTCVSKSTLHFECSVCGLKTQEEGFLRTDVHEHLGEWTVSKEPTCFDKGEKKRQCTDCGTWLYEDINPLGCDFSISYEWSTDNGSVTAKQVCSRNASHGTSETVYTDKNVTKAPTCTETGTAVYTTRAFIHSDLFTTQTKTVTEPAKGHNWGAATYTWDGLTSVKAERICQNDNSHKETETVSVTSQKTKDPTDTDKGETTYTATFTKDCFVTQTKVLADIPSLNETWGDVTVTWASDYSWAEATRVNRQDPNYKQTEKTTNISTEEDKATCMKDGSMTYTATFATYDAFNQSSQRVKTVVLPKTSHKMVTDPEKSADPAPIIKTDDYGLKYCDGWTAGYKEEFCEYGCGTRSERQTIRVPVAIVAEDAEYISYGDNNHVTIDLRVWCGQDDIEDVFWDDPTIAEFITEGCGLHGIGHHSSIDKKYTGSSKAWYYDEQSEFFAEYANRMYDRLDVGGITAYGTTETVSKTSKLTAFQGTSMDIAVTYTPSDTTTYETVTFTVTVIFK